jgi:putative heme-binding domain-containing protein
VLSGLVAGETDERLILVDAQGNRHEVPTSEVEERRLTDLSSMPDGLQTALTLEDFADLIAYLESLK